MSSYVIELEFEKDPSRLLKELGLQTGHFKRIKENILTRLMAHPELTMIVLEFQRSGLFYGEVKYGQSDDYKQARSKRSEIIGRAARRDQSGPKESEANRDDGVHDREDDSGWGLESLLRRQIAWRGSSSSGEADGGD